MFFGPTLLSVLLFLGSAVLALANPTSKIRVLIIDGQNNHDWRPTSALLKDLLIRRGRCEVDVSTTPPHGAPASAWDSWRPEFSAYNVVLSNFNGGHLPDGTRWPLEVELAFKKYVREGGGFVSLHAANNAFLGWTAYSEMVGLLWRDRNFGPSVTIDDHEGTVIQPRGEGREPGHPPRRDILMTTLPIDHPITRGFPKHWLHPSEQLTHGQHGLDRVVRSGVLSILTYARDESLHENEPMDWVRIYGQGRVYVTMLGHTWNNEPSPNLHCVGFQAMLLRGVEWVATGSVTIPIPPDFPTAKAISLRPD